jgi:protein-L-isoaspartate(D-aspartate) O-methyltransferase
MHRLRTVGLTIAVAVLVSGCRKSEPGTDYDTALAGRSSTDAVTKPASGTVSGPIEEHPAFKERVSEREGLVRQGIAGAGVTDERVLKVMRKVPRHAFVPVDVAEEAYANRPLPIGHGQTISQPYIVAAMTEAAQPKPTDRCFEIGTGSGYQAAVLAELCQSVYSIEYLPKVAAFGAKNLRRLGYSNEKVKLRVGDGYKGWPEAAPFDVIVVTAAPEHVPKPLLEQLALRGRLVIPVGPERRVQHLQRWVREKPGPGEDAFSIETLMDVRFVPFLGDGKNK